MIIGLTGKYCSGKNSLLQVFENDQFEVIDVDLLGHQALEVKKHDVISHFGFHFLDAKERIDRHRLAKVVFASSYQLRLLENLTHPWIMAEVEKLVLSSTKPHVVIHAALLHKIRIDQLCDVIIWVQAPFFVRLRRAMKRDRVNILHFLQRVWIQRYLVANSFPKSVDTFLIDNRANLEKTRTDLRNLLITLKI